MATVTTINPTTGQDIESYNEVDLDTARVQVRACHDAFTDSSQQSVDDRPQGVILGIQPWNFSNYQAMRYSIPQLAARNTVILKHAFEILFAGHEVTEELIGMEEIRGATLTGSDRAGATIVVGGEVPDREGSFGIMEFVNMKAIMGGGPDA